MPSPTLRMIPLDSCPITMGSVTVKSPAPPCVHIVMSVPHIPHACISTTTSALVSTHKINHWIQACFDQKCIENLCMLSGIFNWVRYNCFSHIMKYLASSTRGWDEVPLLKKIIKSFDDKCWNIRFAFWKPFSSFAIKFHLTNRKSNLPCRTAAVFESSMLVQIPHQSRFYLEHERHYEINMSQCFQLSMWLCDDVAICLLVAWLIVG